MANPGPIKKLSLRIFTEICTQLAFSSKNLVGICRGLDIDPCIFYNYLEKNETRQQQYQRARELQADLLADEIVEISDNIEIGAKVKETLQGATEITYAHMTAHRRLQIEARRWRAAKLAPKKYSDKLDPSNTALTPEQINIILP